MLEASTKAVSSTDPPDHPVRVAMDDATVRSQLTLAARAATRGKPVDIDDIVQESYQRAWANRDKYDPTTRPVLTWLGGFVRNVAREKLRDLGVAQLPDDGKWDKLVDARHEDGLILAEARLLLDNYLSTLPSEMRQAVELRYFHEMAYEKIGSALGISPANARQRVSRAIAQLAALAKKEERS